VIFEHKDFLVINKPSGIATQGGTKIDFSIDSFLQLYNQTEADKQEFCQVEKLRLVHRLDKDTSGILLIAKNRKAADKITELFNKRQIKKTYIALIAGQLKQKSGVIRNYVAKSGSKFERMRVVSSAQEGDLAVTIYKLLDSSKIASLVELQPETGRTHQLRLHMESLGTPIINDEKYGYKPKEIGLDSKVSKKLFSQLQLHAYKISFTYDGQKVAVKAEMPFYFKENCEKLFLDHSLAQ
jgi:23S rRNA pseudouridine955/2504/2580 synthase